MIIFSEIESMLILKNHIFNMLMFLQNCCDRNICCANVSMFVKQSNEITHTHTHTHRMERLLYNTLKLARTTKLWLCCYDEARCETRYIGKKIIWHRRTYILHNSSRPLVEKFTYCCEELTFFCKIFDFFQNPLKTRNLL
jgi:hypothetical protein